MWRLSYNTWRRGLFNLNDEDYRWDVLRQKLHPALFQIFNFTFISYIQNVLLFSLGFPTFLAAILPHEPLTTTDYTLFASGLGLLAVEFTADNQQWAYQNFKRAFLAEEKALRGAVAALDQGVGGEVRYRPKLPASAYWPFAVFQYAQADAHRGFITRGLWGWSRHPNFLCEQSFWVTAPSFFLPTMPYA
jgi:steroid 5-alpha reductase family enzyme